MRQIREKGYADKFVGPAENAWEKTSLLALAVDGEKRRVTEYIIEEF